MQVDAAVAHFEAIEAVRLPRHRKRGWLVRRALLAADLGGLALAFALAELAFARHTFVDSVSLAAETFLFGLSLPVWVVAAKLYGLYDNDEERTDHSTADDLSRVFHLATACTWLILAGAHLSGVVHPVFAKLFAFWLLSIVFVVASRSAARAYCRRQPGYVQRTLIVGAGDIGQLVARKLQKHPEYGIDLLGFLDAHPRKRSNGLSDVPVLGEPDEVREIVRLLDVERVIVAFNGDRDEETLDLVRDLNEVDVQIDVVPRLFELVSPGVGVHTVEGIPMLVLPPLRLSRSSQFIKRCVDIGGALAGLVLLAPLFAIVALAIKRESRGPVFFRQIRMGTGGVPFRIFKFRTMEVDADERKHELAHLNKHRDGDARMFKIDGDPRVTRVGRLLRRFSIDELPQLLNVLCGDMSLVGPRPLILEEHRHVSAWMRRRMELRPGMTGLWQVLGRSDIGFDEMVKFDYLYVTTWSLGLDLRLLGRTLPAVVRSGVGGD